MVGFNTSEMTSQEIPHRIENPIPYGLRLMSLCSAHKICEELPYLVVRKSVQPGKMLASSGERTGEISQMNVAIWGCDKQCVKEPDCEFLVFQHMVST